MRLSGFAAALIFPHDQIDGLGVRVILCLSERSKAGWYAQAKGLLRETGKRKLA